MTHLMKVCTFLMQMQESMRESQSVYEQAAARIRGSERLRAKLGPGVTVGPAMSQSVSSAVVNGVSSKRVTLIVPVYAQDGRVAQAQVGWDVG